jgi:hypothetical protein
MRRSGFGGLDVNMGVIDMELVRMLLLKVDVVVVFDIQPIDRVLVIVYLAPRSIQSLSPRQCSNSL